MTSHISPAPPDLLNVAWLDATTLIIVAERRARKLGLEE